MGDTDGNANFGVDERADALNRRRLLKGVVAVGVGAAAWTAPNVRTLGFAPAYTQVSSGGVPADSIFISTINAVRCISGECGFRVKLDGTVTCGPDNSYSINATGSRCADGTNNLMLTSSDPNCRITTLHILDVSGASISNHAIPASGIFPIIGWSNGDPICQGKWCVTVDCTI